MAAGGGAAAAVDYGEFTKSWSKQLERGLQADGWGQLVEAAEAYDELARRLELDIETLRPTAEVRGHLNKVLVALKLRSKSLTSVSSGDGPSKEQMNSLLPFIKRVLTDRGLEFPFTVSKYEAAEATRPVESKAEEARSGGSLLTRPALVPGETFVSFELEKWGHKDADTYVDPRVTITVFDPAGTPLETAQDTPLSQGFEERYVLFKYMVNIQTPLSKLRKHNAAIFLEFKHWKPKKNKLSTRSFAFLEMDELREGPIALEQYSKPTDPTRKKLHLHTVKPLYVHINVILHTL